MDYLFTQLLASGIGFVAGVTAGRAWVESHYPNGKSR